MIDFASPLEIIIGFVSSVIIVFYAYKKQSLSLSGSLSAFVLGLIVSLFGGWDFILILFAFFISSSLLSKLDNNKSKDKIHDPRTIVQVLANGGIGAFLVVGYAFAQEDLKSIFRLLYMISFAVATADTWASEIGKLSKQRPIHIITFKSIKKGLSGGVTWLGTIASFFGSLFVYAFSFLSPLIILYGFMGSLLDSILGTIQRKYLTKEHGLVEVLEEYHVVIEQQGLMFLDNNMVNFLSNLIVVSVAAAFI
jgi:uncharacterized protein (TIGR00297 family)